MNLKKFLASLTAAVCCSSVIPALPKLIDETYAAELVSNDFEVTYEGWYANDDMADFVAVPGGGADGSRGMKISNRTSPESGVSSSKGFYLSGGEDYNYSVKVYSETDEVFHISLLCKDLDTDKETVVELASKSVKGGEWTEISANHKAPKNSYEFMITITTESTNDFSFDDVLITAQRSKNQITANAASGNGLKDVFEGYGFRVGNIFNGMTIQNSGIQANILKDCNAIECENETKADAVLVQSGSSNTNVKVSLSRAASILDFCVKNNIAFRGHAIVWHSQTPDWFFKENFSSSGSKVSASTMDQRLESYIKNTFAAYRTQYPTLNLYAYDVCNECINDSNGGARNAGYNENGNGTSGYVNVYGNNSFIEKAFTYAKQYAPDTCKLFYNDYNEFADAKKNGIINSILKPLSAKGVLDGMGMQSHVDASAHNAWGCTDSYLKAMDDYLGLGIDVQVTELDISLDNGQSLNDQATKYKAIVQHIVEANTSNNYKGKVTLFQVWGPNDANTWINGDKSPLLYDKSNQPKSAYTTLMSYGQSLPVGPLQGFEGGGSYTPPEPDKGGYWFHHTFEGTDEGWEGRGGATGSTSKSQAYAGSESFYVTDRSEEWQGAVFNLPYSFKEGEEYSFSANVKYTNGDDSRSFKFTLEYTDASGETTWDEIATVTAYTDQWAQLANTNYKLPSGSGYKIIIETNDGTLEDFYFDEVIGAPAGTKIDGAGQPGVRVVVLGDVNFDGEINVFDVIAARKCIINGITDNMTKKAADVDRSGKYEANDLVLIQEYVMGKIKEFPKAEPQIDVAYFENIFKGVSALESYKSDSSNYTLFTQRFGADPGWMVYDGRLYVYTTNDSQEFDAQNGGQKDNSYAAIKTLNCLSTEDLVNWTDHGVIQAAGSSGAARWANNSWAPDACWKTINGKDKFFLYFADNGSGIGVLTADSPLGPWTDPIGKQLISRQTPNCGNVEWLFDPGVYYDEATGKGYLAFGGGVPSGKEADPGTGRIVELGSDMTSIVGTPTTLNPPYLFEDSSLIKINGTWIYSFCHNWNVPGGQQFSNADIGYMTASNPLGPYTYKGVVFKNTGNQRLDNGGNNHHSIIEFKGEYYVLYHTRRLEMNMGINGGKGNNYRSPAINKCSVNGTSLSCQGSMNGVSQVEALDPYKKVQAETMSNQSKNIKVNGSGNTTVSLGKGQWSKVSGVNFGSGASTFTLRASSKSGAAIKVCAGKANGDAITYVEIPAGSMTEIEVPVINSVTKSTDVYFLASGDVELDWWQFS